MTDARLTDELASRILGWRPAPDRYLTSGGSWITRSRFQPLSELRDAFRLLEAVTQDYTLLSTPGGGFTAEVRARGCIGIARGEPQARAISLALAKVIGLELDRETAPPQITLMRTRGRDGK